MIVKNVNENVFLSNLEGCGINNWIRNKMTDQNALFYENFGAVEVGRLLLRCESAYGVFVEHFERLFPVMEKSDQETRC